MAVVAPAVDLIVVAPARRQRALRRIERQLLGFAAIRRHHVDLLIAVVLPGERDPFAVRRELGEQLYARMRSEPRGRASRRVDQPQIAAVSEYDAVVMYIRKAKDLGLRGERRAEGQAQKQRGLELKTHRVSDVIELGKLSLADMKMK